MESPSTRQFDRGRSPGPSKGSGGDAGGFGEAGGLPGPPKGTQGLRAPQAPKTAPGMVVTIQGAKEVEAPQRALPRKSLPKTPVTAVAAQGAQEVKQGVLQDPHTTTTKIPKDLQTQFLFGVV